MRTSFIPNANVGQLNAFRQSQAPAQTSRPVNTNGSKLNFGLTSLSNPVGGSYGAPRWQGGTSLAGNRLNILA